jgi:predicted nicotinamide N-methyase
MTDEPPHAGSPSTSVRGYQTKQERIAIVGVQDLIIRSLLDRQQFFDPFGEADRIGISSAAWPLFGLLWPSGAHLAARMALRPVCSTERILEIGCGLALASLVGHRRGADVTASDCHPLAERFLEENLRLNDLPPMKYRHGHWSVPEALPECEDTSALHTIHGHYDLIIGSDLLYERDANAALAGFIARHSSAAAVVWIVDPNRGNRPAFNRQMAAEGFLMQEEMLNEPASIGAAGYKGRLLIYRRAAKAATATVGARTAGASYLPG